MSVLDITASILDLAGIEIPAYYDGKPLFDLRNDPHELHNLATDAAHSEQLTTMRNVMEQWQQNHIDRGLLDKDNRTPEDMGQTRTYLQEHRPEVWKYITEGAVIDNYSALRKEASKYYKSKK